MTTSILIMIWMNKSVARGWRRFVLLFHTFVRSNVSILASIIVYFCSPSAWLTKGGNMVPIVPSSQSNIKDCRFCIVELHWCIQELPLTVSLFGSAVQDLRVCARKCVCVCVCVCLCVCVCVCVCVCRVQWRIAIYGMFHTERANPNWSTKTRSLHHYVDVMSSTGENLQWQLVHSSEPYVQQLKWSLTICRHGITGGKGGR